MGSSRRLDGLNPKDDCIDPMRKEEKSMESPGGIAIDPGENPRSFETSIGLGSDGGVHLAKPCSSEAFLPQENVRRRAASGREELITTPQEGNGKQSPKLPKADDHTSLEEKGGPTSLTLVPPNVFLPLKGQLQGGIEEKNRPDDASEAAHRTALWPHDRSPDTRSQGTRPHDHVPCARSMPVRPHDRVPDPRSRPFSYQLPADPGDDPTSNKDQHQASSSPRSMPSTVPRPSNDRRPDPDPDPWSTTGPRDHTTREPSDPRHADQPVDPYQITCRSHDRETIPPTPPSSPKSFGWATTRQVTGRDHCGLELYSKAKGMDSMGTYGNFTASPPQVCSITSIHDQIPQVQEEKRKPWNDFEDYGDWTWEEREEYFAEEAIELFGNLSRGDTDHDDFFTDEDDDGEPRDAYSCMATRVPHDNLAEDIHFRRFQKEVEALEPERFRPKRPPSLQDEPDGDDRAKQAPHPRRLPSFCYDPGPVQWSHINKNRTAFRLPHQVYQDRANAIARPRHREDRLEGLMDAYLDYQKLVERTTNDRIDKINDTLCLKIKEVWSFVRSYGGAGIGSGEAIDRRLGWIEETLSDHLRELIDNSKERCELSKLIGKLFDFCDEISLNTLDREKEMSTKIRELEIRANQEAAMKGAILRRIYDLEEALSDELARVTGSHNVLRELDKKLNDMSEHVTGHEEDRKPDDPYDDDIEEDKLDLASRDVAMSRHEPHPLRVLEKGESSGKKGDPPYVRRSEGIGDVTRRRPTGTIQEIRLEANSPSA